MRICAGRINFFNAGVNAGAPTNYILTYQLTEGDLSLLHGPIHGPGEDRENILQYYGIFDYLLPWKTMCTLKNEQWLNDDVINCLLKLLAFCDERIQCEKRSPFYISFIVKK